jgi:hypothetical protein
MAISFAAPALSENLLNEPEGIVFDTTQHRYLVSNWRTGTVVQIDSLGQQSYFKTGLGNCADLIIVAARPGLGKTSLCLNIALHAALRKQMTVAIFSLEMSKEALVKRLLCAEGEIDLHKVNTGYLNREDWTRLGRAAGGISQSRIFIDDSASISIGEMRSKARRLSMEHKLDLVVVDYLQLMLRVRSVSKTGRRKSPRSRAASRRWRRSSTSQCLPYHSSVARSRHAGETTGRSSRIFGSPVRSSRRGSARLRAQRNSARTWFATLIAESVSKEFWPLPLGRPIRP